MVGGRAFDRFVMGPIFDQYQADMYARHERSTKKVADDYGRYLSKYNLRYDPDRFYLKYGYSMDSDRLNASKKMWDAFKRFF